MEPSEAAAARPYRSHKFPACDFCHRRKSRCERTRQDEPCSLCRFHHRECVTSPGDAGPQGPRRRSRAPRTRARTSTRARPSGGSTSATPRDEPDATLGVDGVEPPPLLASNMQSTTEQQSRHIVGPSLARDAQVLEQYISPRDGTAVSHVRPNPYSVYSDDPRDPVVYMKVPRQRSSAASGNGTVGFKQCEIIENILGSLRTPLVQLYFDVIHPAFPILDQAAVMKAYQRGTLPHALTCEIYAVSILFWKLSPTIALTRRPPPDVHYIWNLAVSAMHKDFLSPTLSTVLACVLDIWGRPITSVTYNAVNIGSTVALAQSQGLNRNPSDWDLDPRQKNLRIRAWWGLLIHDYWASLCHGTPSHIHHDQWDVPLPDLDCLVPGEPDNEVLTKGAQSFIALCQLTTLLGGILPLIYVLRRGSLESTMRHLQQTETAIDEWEASLPPWLNAGSATFDRSAPGVLNLRLSHLALGLCIRRIALQETRRADCGREEIRYQQSQCRKAAAVLIEFVTSLSRDETQSFWLPYTAYHFVSAATLLMRCALESQSDSVARHCVDKARSLTDYLRKMKMEVDWDLANICLGQCEMTVTQMSESSSLLDFRRRHQAVDSEPEDAAGELQALSTGTPSAFQTSVTETHDWQTEISGDFYFPDLWQASYLDTPPGA